VNFVILNVDRNLWCWSGETFRCGDGIACDFAMEMPRTWLLGDFFHEAELCEFIAIFWSTFCECDNSLAWNFVAKFIETSVHQKRFVSLIDENLVTKSIAANKSSKVFLKLKFLLWKVSRFFSSKTFENFEMLTRTSSAAFCLHFLHSLPVCLHFCASEVDCHKNCD
jgi:hypothetical protein